MSVIRYIKLTHYWMKYEKKIEIFTKNGEEYEQKSLLAYRIIDPENDEELQKYIKEKHIKELCQLPELPRTKIEIEM